MGAVIVLQWLPPSHPLPSRSYDIGELNFKWLHPSRIRPRLYSSKKKWKEREGGWGWEEEREGEGRRERGKKKKKERDTLPHSTTLHKGVPFYSRGKLAGEQVNERQIFFFSFFFFSHKSNYSSFHIASASKSNGDKYDNSHGSNDL